MLSFVNFAPAILFTVSQGGVRWNRQNPVQTSARTQERCPSTTLGGSACVRVRCTDFCSDTGRKLRLYKCLGTKSERDLGLLLVCNVIAAGLLVNIAWSLIDMFRL